MAIDIVRRLSDARWHFYLVTTAWKDFAATPELQWQRVAFSPKSHVQVPKSSGLYAFVARVSNSQLPEHGYVMYVGETGEKNGRTLYERYDDYLKWKRREKRPVIRDMFERLNGALSFYFAPVTGKHVARLTKVETALLNALVPPCNEADFSADIAKARKVLWRR